MTEPAYVAASAPGERNPRSSRFVSWRTGLLISCLVGSVVAITLVYRPTVSPVGLEDRGIEYGAATTRLALSGTPTPVADSVVDYVPYRDRGSLLARLVALPATREVAAAAVGIDPSRLVIDTQPSILRPLDVEAQAPDRLASRSGGSGYTVVYRNYVRSAVVQVYTTAPTPDEARKLADGVAAGVRRISADLERTGNPARRIKLRVTQATPARGGDVNSGAPVQLTILLAAVLSGALALVWRFVSGWRGDVSPRRGARSAPA